MTDWRECLVVRDRENTLWGRDPWTTDDPHQRRWIAVGSAGLGADGCYEDEMERRYSPITPVLDADGLPVVHTVGDLTARHLRRDISVEGMRTATLLAMRQSPRGQPLPLVAFLVRIDGTIGTTDYYPLDTPCEVLP